MAKCIECQQDLPSSAFRPNNRRCIECCNKAQNAARWYSSCKHRPCHLWTPALVDYMKRCVHLHASYQGQPVFTKAVQEMLDIYTYKPDEAPPTDLSLELLWHELQRCHSRITELERTLKRALVPQRRCGTDKQDTDRDLARYTDAVHKAGVEPEVKAALLKAYHELPLVQPTTIRSIVFPYESEGVAVPLGLLAIYNRWFLPAFLRAAEAKEYPQLVQDIVDITGVNYYELDWAEIPT